MSRNEYGQTKLDSSVNVLISQSAILWSCIGQKAWFLLSWDTFNVWFVNGPCWTWGGMNHSFTSLLFLKFPRLTELQYCTQQNAVLQPSQSTSEETEAQKGGQLVDPGPDSCSRASCMPRQAPHDTSLASTVLYSLDIIITCKYGPQCPLPQMLFIVKKTAFANSASKISCALC